MSKVQQFFDWLAEEGGVKHFINQWLRCRKGHDWRNAGDWDICTRCDALEKVPEPARARAITFQS